MYSTTFQPLSSFILALSSLSFQYGINFSKHFLPYCPFNTTRQLEVTSLFLSDNDLQPFTFDSWSLQIEALGCVTDLTLVLLGLWSLLISSHDHSSVWNSPISNIRAHSNCNWPWFFTMVHDEFPQFRSILSHDIPWLWIHVTQTIVFYKLVTFLKFMNYF